DTKSEVPLLESVSPSDIDAAFSKEAYTPERSLVNPSEVSVSSCEDALSSSGDSVDLLALDRQRRPSENWIASSLKNSEYFLEGIPIFRWGFRDLGTIGLPFSRKRFEGQTVHLFTHFQ
uniref:Uncharacterized protein n=1 Tax=Tetraodon nigroviridis TaxID=99883 RepID=H3C4R7_TETNG